MWDRTSEGLLAGVHGVSCHLVVPPRSQDAERPLQLLESVVAEIGHRRLRLGQLSRR